MATTTAPASRSARLGLRAMPEQEAVLRRAADVAHKSLTEFILDSAYQAAEQTLLDQRLFMVSGKQYRALPAIAAVARGGAGLDQVTRRDAPASRVVFDDIADEGCSDQTITPPPGGVIVSAPRRLPIVEFRIDRRTRQRLQTTTCVSTMNVVISSMKLSACFIACAPCGDANARFRASASSNQSSTTPSIGSSS